MYSRNLWDKRDSYSLPPGYDGSRFRRRHRRNEDFDQGSDVIIVPDSSYAAVDHKGDGELSVGGIPTEIGISRQRHSSTVENAPEPIPPVPDEAETVCEIWKSGTPSKDKLSDILEKLGFHGGLSSDDLLLCAVIFIIASDRGRDPGYAGDILLILALLLGIK